VPGPYGGGVSILVLWATPRTVSTAFERMMIERGDRLVLDEPWSRAYYFGPERRSGRFGLTFPEATYAAVEEGVLDAGASEPVFVKDMAYHAEPAVSDDALAAMTHTFLIREPRAAVTSLARAWPDFTDDEAGYAAQGRLFDRVAEVTGRPPVVVDSDELRSDPPGVTAGWCAHVGIEHRPSSLTWTPGMRPEWQLWRDWYATAAASTGFAPPDGSPGDAGEAFAPVLAERVEAVVDSARPVYEHLRRHTVPSRP
jgi:hypothetical protein